MLGDAGRRASAADPAAIAAYAVASRPSPRNSGPPSGRPEWPIYGALIINLRNIVDAMDEVAEANPIGGNRLPLRIPVRRA